MILYKKYIDFDNRRGSIIFLIFIVLFIQKIILLKIVGVLLIYFFYPFVFLYKNRFTLKFYYFLILYTIFGSLPYIDQKNYYVAYLLSIVFWTISYLSAKQTYYFVARASAKDVNKVILLLFYINAFAVIINYCYAVYYYNNIFPWFVHNSAGDFMKGIYANSSIAMIIFSIFLSHFVYQKKIVLSSVAFSMMLSTTYMSGIILFLGCIIIYSFVYTKINIFTRIGLLFIVPIVSLMLIKNFSPTNYAYAKSILLISGNLPRKLISFFQTYKYVTESIQHFFLGAGSGNFSSRVAFLVAGEYVSWIPMELVYISKDFLRNHFSLWNMELLLKGYNDGTANQPFSFYNQIFGEYGLIGAIFFVIYYLKSLFSERIRKELGFFLIILLSSYFLLDYWFEYFSVITIFELIFLSDCCTDDSQDRSGNKYRPLSSNLV